MKMTKFTSLSEDFKTALLRLEEVLQMEKNDVIRDSAIQRFEIVFDLAWKTLKAFLEEYHNITCSSPRNCFRESFRQKLIDYDEFWIEITSLRNYTAHTYSEKLAEKVYNGLPQALAYFQKLSEEIQKQIKE